MNTATEVKRETLNIRIKPHERSLIDRAAKSRGRNRTDFILDAARLAAEDALLDLPPTPNTRLRKTMKTPAPWER